MTRSKTSAPTHLARETFYLPVRVVGGNQPPVHPGDPLPSSSFCCDETEVAGELYKRDELNWHYVTDTEGRHWKVTSPSTASPFEPMTDYFEHLVERGLAVRADDQVRRPLVEALGTAVRELERLNASREFALRNPHMFEDRDELQKRISDSRAGLQIADLEDALSAAGSIGDDPRVVELQSEIAHHRHEASMPPVDPETREVV